MAAMGDSITAGVNTTALGIQRTNSWATGVNPDMSSYYQRLVAISPELSGRADNVSVAGSRIAGIAGRTTEGDPQQIERAVAEAPLPELFLLLTGANDICHGSEDGMTSVTDFGTYADRIIADLRTAAPEARVLIASIPDLYQLWSVLHTDPNAVAAWNGETDLPFPPICQSMLANPESTAAEDEDRRQRVRQRIIDYNAELERACRGNPHCRFDGGAVFGIAFTTGEVSDVDYFHPSLQGQDRLAEVVWTAGFDYADTSAPVSTATEEVVDAAHSRIALTATDAEGVSGIEFRFPGLGWTTYVSPIDLYTGEKFDFRAVDVNGNTESRWVYEFGVGVSQPTPPEEPDPDAGQDPDGPGPGVGCGGCGGEFGTFGAMAAIAGLFLRPRRREA